MRYVNPWPLPTQKPHPPVWIPGSRSRDTLVEIAKRGYCYFLSSRSHGKETARSQQLFAQILREHGDSYQPARMGILMSAYVAETDAQAQAEAKEGVWYFLKNCLKGHLRREGRQLTFGPGVPYIPPEEYKRFLQADPTAPLLGDAESWDDLQQSSSIIVGSADTVYERIMDILTHSKVGNLLIQFHLGNMADALTRKSMTTVRDRGGAAAARRFRQAVRARIPRSVAHAGDGEVTFSVAARTVLVIMPSPRPCGEWATRSFNHAQSGEGQPLTHSYHVRDLLALSPQERGEGATSNRLGP